MTDWADGIETRNYGIRSEIDANMLSDLFRTIIPLVAIAGALLFYSWVRSQIINIGYETQNLFTLEQSLEQTQKRLILEEETLRNPERIGLIARVDLGMTPLHPNQLIVPEIRDLNAIPGDMAMSGSGTPMLARRIAPGAEIIPTN